MKIFSKILIGGGLILSLICSLIILYATYAAMTAVTEARSNESGGAGAIATVSWALSASYLASFPNVFGLLLIVFGVILSLFARKQ